MQCPGCQGEILVWQFYCPDCRTQLRWTTGTSLTAYEIGKPAPSEPPPSRKLPVILAAAVLSGVVLAVIVISDISHWTAVRHPSLTQNAALLTESVALAESVVNRPVVRHVASTVSEQKLEEKAVPPLAPQSTPRESRKPPAKLELSEHSAQPVVAPAAPSAAPKSTTTEPVKSVEINAEPLGSAFDPRMSLLTIKSDTRARIYVNGQFSGVTPRTIRLLAGEHTITLSADGCDDWSRKIQLQGRQQMNIVAALSQKTVTAQTDSSR